jgi:hypothetical protein
VVRHWLRDGKDGRGDATVGELGPAFGRAAQMIPEDRH